MIKKKLRKTGKIFIILLSLFLFYIFIIGRYGLINIITLKMDIVRTEKRIGILTAEKVSLEREKEKLEKDSLYVERIARERFGMVKDSERCYRFVK